MRFIGLLRADADSEANVLPSPDLMETIGVLVEEMVNAGVIIATDGLKPSSEGRRVKLEDGKLTVIDGPFTESKELIASYAVIECPTIEDAVRHTTRFLEVLGKGECEIRPIFGLDDFPEDILPDGERAKEEALRAQMLRNAAQ